MSSQENKAHLCDGVENLDDERVGSHDSGPSGAITCVRDDFMHELILHIKDGDTSFCNHIYSAESPPRKQNEDRNGLVGEEP